MSRPPFYEQPSLVVTAYDALHPTEMPGTSVERDSRTAGRRR